MEEAQWWTQERVLCARDQGLRELVRVAYEDVPFYRDLMRGAGVCPKDIGSPRDLSRLPIVTKKMLRDNYPSRVTRVTGRATYEAATSGSTGANFRVLLDRETAGWYRASFLLALEWAGWNIGEPHLQTGMTPERGLEKRLKDLFLGCHYVSAYDLSDARLDHNLELIDRHRLRHVWGYPGSLYYLARRALARGWSQPLKSVVTWGDNLFPHYRRTIEAAFRTRVNDTYGCAEGIQVSAQCGTGDAYHVHMLDVVVEFVDDDGRPVKDGVPGNVVLTRLHPGPMPLIRYKVGDLGSAVPQGITQCGCGRGFQIISAPQGRNTDVVITPSGNRLIVHFFTGVLELFTEIDSFQVVQENSDDLLLRVVPTPDWRALLEQRLVAALRARGLTDMRITVELVKELPLSPGGKRRFVINKTLQDSSAACVHPPQAQ
jgi:phenylacetate-CoA ligase